jgi:hypothetical protein
MTQRFNSRSQPRRWVSRLAAASVLGLAGVSFVGLSGCDTVARISFSERRAESIHSAGVTSPAGQCGGVDGSATMRFVMLANDMTPIIEGDDLAGVLFDLRSRDVELRDGRVFSLPDQLCSSNNDCPGNMVCTKASDSLGDQYRRCNVSSDVSLSGEPRFAADLAKNQLFGVLFENAGSLRGWLPEDVGRLRPVDADGNPIPGTGQDTGPIAARATDQRVARGPLLTGLESNWDHVFRYARRTNRNTNFGFWTFSGSRATVLSQVASVHPQQLMWTGQYDRVSQATTNYRINVEVERTRAAVYEAINTVIEQGYSQPEHEGWEKQLVVFVDGPDDLRLTQNHTAETVIANARAAGVRLFIVHLDSKVDANLLRDDYRYYENQSPCTDNSQCLNFEECRVPQLFSDGLSGTVTYPTSFESNPDARYCLPALDENGRIGPIEDYSRIACATEGGYIYVPSAQALRSRAEWLPFALDGLWEMDVEIAEAQRGNLFPGQPYKLQTTKNLQLGDLNRTYQYSQQGRVQQAIDDDDAADTRAVFFKAP